MNKLKFIIILLVLFLLSACQRSMSYENYLARVNNPVNGIVQEKTINGVNIKVSYRPCELMVYQELKERENISREQLWRSREKYSNQHYFIISYSRAGKDLLSQTYDKSRYSNLVHKISYSMDEFVYLTTSDDDTLRMLGSHSPRHFGVAETTDILMAFEKVEEHRSLTVHLDEMGLDLGNTRFKFLSKDITRINKGRIKFK